MKAYVLFFPILLLFQFTCKAQYTHADKDLVQTTYTRQFDKSIENKYLHSNDSVKVNAALLSLAQSEDTSWVKEILQLDFGKHSKFICFALGELGKNIQSVNFLLSKLSQTNNSDKDIHDILETLGKVGNLNTYNFLFKSYNKNRLSNFDGISLALYNFYIRKIGEKQKSISILYNELLKYKFPCRRNFEAAFALYRIGSTPKINKLLSEELKSYFNFKDSSELSKKYAEITIPYFLGCLQLNKYFPGNKTLFNKLLRSNNFTIKIAAIKALVFYPFNNKKDLNLYLDLLNDKNPNIAIELASSVKFLELNDSLKIFLKNFLIKATKNKNYTANTRGELFLSYIKLFKPDFEYIKNEYEQDIPKEYFYKECGLYTKFDDALEFLLNKFSSVGGKDKISILESALKFQNNTNVNNNLYQLIINSLNSKSPALISIAADGIDSSYITPSKSRLSGIIKRQVQIYKDNPDYLESLMSLTDLAEKIDNNLYKSVLKNLGNSEEYSIKKYAYKQLGLPTSNLVKDNKYFNSIWADAFKYKYAEIYTVKGNFKIKFLPKYAPVSAGNFCYLAKKKFFNQNIFHRVVPGFVIQGGDPEETGWGGPGYDIVSEFSPLNYNVGMVGMASAGKDTEGSQWFVTTGNYPHLNGRYTIFAETIKNINVVYNIAQGDRIIRINLVP